MPVLKSGPAEHPCEIFYEVKGDYSTEERREGSPCSTSYGKRPDVVLIMGFAATHHCWNPQLEDLLRRKVTDGPPKARVLVLDNRGVGRSGSPETNQAYTTTLMATDVVSILDHLGWGKVHVVGHSMGSMIAAKMAALVPERICSLALISPTGGGWEAVPRSWACFKVCFQMLFARTAQQRAWLDLQVHFSKKMLTSVDPKYGRTREELLHESYMEGAEGGGTGQSNHGFSGQLHAVWSHRLSQEEIELIRGHDIPVMVIHGRHDVLALPRYGERLAQRFEAPCILLEGAHMLCRERGPEVNLLLHHHIFHGRRLKDTQHKFLIDDPDTSVRGKTLESSPPLPAPKSVNARSSSASEESEMSHAEQPGDSGQLPMSAS